MSLFTFLIVLMAPVVAFGQSATSTPAEGLTRSPADVAKVMGWTRHANLGANVAFSSSQDVVGQTDGSSQTYGLNLKGGLNRNSAEDEWRNTFSLMENLTRNPNMDRYIKSDDEFKVSTIYLRSLARPDMGPYVQGEASAPVFKGEDVRATVQTYRVTRKDQADQVYQGTSTRLTEGFRPLNTKESVGAFWKAVESDKLRVEARLGFGAMQVNADGQLVVKGANAAGEIVLNELSNVSQGGLEAALGVKGKIDEKSSYEAGLDTLTPFFNNKSDADSRSAFDLTNVDGFIKLNSAVTAWAAFSYDYKIKIQPQLVTRAQQIHMLVLNVNYNLF